MANERKQAIDHPTFPKDWPKTEGMSDEQLMSYAIKSLPDVIRGLLIPYQEELYITQGYSYIPWEQSAAHLNKIFGYFGWTTKEVSSRQVHRTYERDNFTVEEDGIEAVICLTVRAFSPTGIIEKPIENVGYAKMLNTDKGADTAVKAARSDALSRACKLLGDAFGLYLYEKPEEAPRQNNYPPRNNPPTNGQPPRASNTNLPPANGNSPSPANQKERKCGVTMPMYNTLSKKGLRDDEIEQLARDRKASPAIGMIIEQQATAEDIRREFLGRVQFDEELADHPF